MAGGRIEAAIVVPTGGWVLTVGGATVTLAAGTYYLSGLLEDLAAAIATATADTCTITASLGEGGTGIVTITLGTAAAVAWDDTDLRDLLGFEGDLAAAAEHVGTLHARGVWLADCAYEAPNAVLPWVGWPETDARTVESMSGAVYSFVGSSKQTSWLKWSAVKRSRALRANEALAGESFQRLLEDGIWGFAAWGQPGGPVRFYPDADSAQWVEYAVVLPDQFKPGQFVDGWAGGPWTVELERLVYQDDHLSEAPPAGRATIVPTVATSGTSSTDGTSVSTSSYTPPADTPLYARVIYARTAAVGPAPTASGNGLTWVEVETVTYGASLQHGMTVFRALGAAPAAGALTFDFGAESYGSFQWDVIACADADATGSEGSGATVQAAGNTAASGVLAINGTLAELEHENNVHLAFVGVRGNVAVTEDADFASLVEQSGTDLAATSEAEWAANETVCSPTLSSSFGAGIISIEVKAAVA